MFMNAETHTAYKKWNSFCGMTKSRTLLRASGRRGLRAESPVGATSRRYCVHEALLLTFDVHRSRFSELHLKPRLDGASFSECRLTLSLRRCDCTEA